MSSTKFSGVGYTISKSKKDNQRAYNIWREMLRRCYNDKADRYDLYGGAGVTVDKSWWCFDTFLEDIIYLEGYDEKLFNDRKIQLDKDKLQYNIKKENRVYSKETCCWLTREEQFQYADHEYRHKKFIAISPNNQKYISNNQRDFAEYFQLQYQNLNKCLNGFRKSHMGWKFYYLDNDTDINDVYYFEKVGENYVINQ